METFSTFETLNRPNESYLDSNTLPKELNASPCFLSSGNLPDLPFFCHSPGYQKLKQASPVWESSLNWFYHLRTLGAQAKEKKLYIYATWLYIPSESPLEKNCGRRLGRKEQGTAATMAGATVPPPAAQLLQLPSSP
jgi:hypothetical protein